MSKTGGGGILLTETGDAIASKLRKAVTSSEPRVIREAWHAAESGDLAPQEAWKGNPNLVKQFHGVRNLFTILLSLGKKNRVEPWKEAAEYGTLKFSEFKPALAEIIADHFAPFRKRRAELAAKPKEVEAIVEKGIADATAVANETLLEVQQRMGLR